MLPPPVKKACSAILGTTVYKASFLSGGDINEARLLETGQGPAFLKMNTRPNSAHMFQTEAKGLRLLGSSGAIMVPGILGQGEADGYAFLLLEYIEEASPTPAFWRRFGQALAQLHRTTNEYFGLEYSNYIGSLPQPNGRHDNWAGFYIQERLQPQLEMAVSAQKLWPEAGRQFENLYKKLPEICPDEPPSLIHGDLWSGNFMSAPGDTPVLIDPSVSFAHREMDLAMSRLFGGFSKVFYQAYQEAFPCETGLEERLDIYQLYYLLAHVNLFGGGYAQSVRRIIGHYQ